MDAATRPGFKWLESDLTLIAPIRPRKSPFAQMAQPRLSSFFPCQRRISPRFLTYDQHDSTASHSSPLALRGFDFPIISRSGGKKYLPTYDQRNVTRNPITHVHGTHKARAIHHVRVSKYEMTNPLLQATQAMTCLYVGETRISFAQCGHANLAVKRTSSTPTLVWHSGHFVRSEYERNSIKDVSSTISSRRAPQGNARKEPVKTLSQREQSGPENGRNRYTNCRFAAA